MSTMTLEQVRDDLRELVRDASIEGAKAITSCIPVLEDWADAIDAHLRERESAKAVLDALGYVPGELDKTAPERIWLQIDTAASNNDREEPWPGCDGVTWQDESMDGLEIQYVRADLVAPMLASARVPDDKWLKLAQELEVYKEVVPSPIGPLHGAGMALAYQNVAKTIRYMLAAAPKRGEE